MKKKLTVVLMAVIMVFALVLTGCGNDSSSGSKNDETKVQNDDTSAADGDDGGETNGDENAAGDWKNKDVADWNGDDIGQYFIDNGTFSHSDWYYVQKNEYVEGTGFDANVSYFDEDAGAACVMIMWFNPDSAQTNRDEVYDYIKANQMLPEEFSSIIVDHLVGNFAFSYTLCADDAEYDNMDAAYKAFIEEFNLTPEF